MSEELPRALSQSEMEMIEARMAQRNERLAEKCSEFGLDVHGIIFNCLFIAITLCQSKFQTFTGNDSWHQPNPWEFLVNTNYHIIW